jgi:tryptophan-rich sensory protein
MEVSVAASPSNFGIVKTIIFLLAGYSLSYVDENKTNQNTYHGIILYIPAAPVQ